MRAMNREKKTIGREYPKRYNNHIIIQIRYGKMELGLWPPEATAPESQGTEML